MPIQTSVLRTALATRYGVLCPYVALAVTAPGAVAGTEVSGGGYARKASNWGAAVNSVITAAPAAFNVPAGTTVVGVNLMSALTGGVYQDGCGVTPQQFTSPGTYTVTVTNTHGTPPAPGVLDKITSDAFGPHDAIPRGVPTSYSWQPGAVNDPNTSSYGYQAYGAVNVWAQCFATVGGGPNYNVRVQSRDPRIYFFDGTTWTRATLTAGSSSGAYYEGSFQSVRTDASPRSEGSGVYSASLSALSSGTYDAYHWWWNGMFPRIAIPAGCQGILTCMDMRLVADDGFTGIAGASFEATANCDLFLTTTTTSDPSGTNDGLLQARMKFVTGEWQRFYNTTVNRNTIMAIPPGIASDLTL